MCVCTLNVQAEGETATPESTATPTAAAASTTAVETSAKGAVLMDATSGSVLFENNSTAHLDPASLTKIMSVYLATEKLTPDQELTMSDTAFQTYSHNSGVLWIQNGETMTAVSAEYASLLASANDTTAMLAEGVSGDQDTFIALMNSTAQSIGMGDTNFQNIFGTNNEENYSSAKDIATLVQTALKNTTFKKIFGTSGYVMAATNLTSERPIGNDCELLPGQDSAYEYTTGCKIGSTQEGGYALAASAEKDGTTLIAVVLGETDAATAYADVQKMLDYGFSSYHTITLSGSDVGSKTVAVYSGKKHTYDVVFTENSDFSLLVSSSIDKSQITMDIVTQHEDLEDPNQITASVVFSIDGTQVGSVPMKAEITEIDNSFSATVEPQISQYFDYACIVILALVLIYEIGRKLSPPAE